MKIIRFIFNKIIFIFSIFYYKRIKTKVSFYSKINKSTTLNKNILIEKGVIISNSTIDNNSKIRKYTKVSDSKVGDNVIIENNSLVDECIIESNIKIGEYSNLKNVRIKSNVMLSGNLSLFNVSINSFSYLTKNANVLNTTIGKFCSIGANFTCGLGKHPTNDFVSTSPIFYSKNNIFNIIFSDKNYFSEYEQIIIGNDVWIGADVMIKDGVKIGDGAIVGAKSFVSKDIEPYSIVGGVPAKLIRYRFSKDLIEKLLKFKWWDRDIKWLNDNYKLFHKVSDFIKLL